MGYQLNRVTLCTLGDVGVMPTCQGVVPAVSPTTSGGNGLVQFKQMVPPEFHLVQAGAIPVLSTTPSPLRSAGSCNNRIAFGFTGFVPGAVGAAVPRANPRFSHSLVTACQLPVESSDRSEEHTSELQSLRHLV